MEVLLDNHRYKTLVESFPVLRSAVIEFLAKTMDKVKLCQRSVSVILATFSCR